MKKSNIATESPLVDVLDIKTVKNSKKFLFDKRKNLLKNTRCYLIGHMQYSDGRGWREVIQKSLKNSGIMFYDPYNKPFIEKIPEDEISRAEMLHWMETEQYDMVSQRMRSVRDYDLRLCDYCDLFVAVIKPTIASWGSAEEISAVVRAKKPLFLVIDDPRGKKACPLWLMGAVSHKYIYNNLVDVIEMIQAIDMGIVKMNSDRWKLLLPHFR